MDSGQHSFSPCYWFHVFFVDMGKDGHEGLPNADGVRLPTGVVGLVALHHALCVKEARNIPRMEARSATRKL